MAFRLPVFASPNESLHYEVVALLHQMGQLPNPAASERADERHQSPFYYLIVGAAALPLRGPTPLDTQLVGNPHFGSTHQGNLNPKIHTTWQNLPLQYVGRFVSMLFGVVGILGVSLATRPFASSATRLLAVSLFAFHPMVLFLGASLSNDLPVAAMAALVLGYSTTIMMRPRTWRAFVLWGILLAVAVLTKASAIFLLLLLPFVCLAQWHHRRALRPIVLSLLSALAAFAFIWAIWIFYNLLRDLDPLGVERSIRLGRLLALRPSDLPQFVPYLPSLWRTFTMDWSVGGLGFGPPPLYWAVAIGLLTGLLGWIWVRPRGVERLCLAMNVSWIVPVVVLYLASNLSILRGHGIVVAEGRLLVLILPSLAWLTAGGWRGWLPTRWPAQWRAAIEWALLAAWVLTAILLVGIYLPHLYPRMKEISPTASNATSGSDANAPLVYEEKLTLHDVTIPERLTVGELTPVDLTWDALDVLTRDYTISLQLLLPTNPQWTKVESQNSYPGLGMNPTMDWKLGTRYQDRFYVRPQGELNGPTRVHLVVWALDGAVEGDALTVTRMGEIQDPPIARSLVMVPAEALEIPQSAAIETVEFGEQIELAGLEQRIDEAGVLQLIAYWRAKGDLSEDYSIFVHWLDTSGQVAAQSDAMPNNGLTPTSLWRAGDVVRDTYTIPAIIGSIEGLRLGVYRLTTLERLSANQAGNHLPDGALTLKLHEIAQPAESQR